MKGSHYLHGTHAKEQARLALMNELLNDAALREMGLSGGEFVLDVGCGTALLAREMAAEVGEEGRVVGIERDEAQIVEATRLATQDEARVELRIGDASSLPLREREWGSFDVVHARFLLEHLPDPIVAVRQMVRAARLGGRVVLTDDDHENFRLYPEPEGFGTLWSAYRSAFERLGNDPHVGRKLVALLTEAGATQCRNSMLFFGAADGDASFDAATGNLIGVLEGAREAVVEVGLAEAEFDRALGALRQWTDLPGAALWYAANWAEGYRAGE